MLVLPLPHHSALRYSICYSSLNDSHDHPLFSTCLCSPSPLLLLSLPLSSTLPPGHSLYFSCTHCHRCSSAIVLALCRSFAFAAPLLLQPKHTHTTHTADPPWLTSANGTVNTHTHLHSMTALNPTLALPTEDCRSTPAHKAPAC